MKQALKALLPPIVLGFILASVFILPRHSEMVESAISPELPLGYSLPGWRGIKVQESEKERSILAADTRFSKARYTRQARMPWETESAPVEVSIVYSGQDMNSSIHRPERCLPAQGHQNLVGKTCQLPLSNGKALSFTRLSSQVPLKGQKASRLNFVHYYVFIGHDSICHTHLGRTLQDMSDRVLKGYVQRWAYFQVGTYWAPELGITEQEADQKVQTLISELLPRQIDWQRQD